MGFLPLLHLFLDWPLRSMLIANRAFLLSGLACPFCCLQAPDSEGVIYSKNIWSPENQF